MASATKAYKVRKRLKAKKAGRKRKTRQGRSSTPSQAQVFGDEKEGSSAS